MTSFKSFLSILQSYIYICSDFFIVYNYIHSRFLSTFLAIYVGSFRICWCCKSANGCHPLIVFCILSAKWRPLILLGYLQKNKKQIRVSKTSTDWRMKLFLPPYVMYSYTEHWYNSELNKNWKTIVQYSSMWSVISDNTQTRMAFLINVGYPATKSEHKSRMETW